MEGTHATAEGTSAESTRSSEWSAFVAFYRANVTTVYRYLHRRCRDHAVAEDLTQEVFTELIASGRPVGEFGTGWLVTTAQHRLIDRVRRQERYHERLQLLRGGLDDTHPERDAVDGLVLAQALGQLGVDQRLVLCLHYLDGLPVADLATRLGRTPKSVEGLLSRARRNLHRELERIDE